MIASVADLQWLDAAIARVREASDQWADLRHQIIAMASVTDWKSQAMDAYRAAHEQLDVDMVHVSGHIAAVEAELSGERARAMADLGTLSR